MIYVDDMYQYPMGQFGRMKMSHLMGDNEVELHAFAKSIGMRRSWYQGDHYDVSMSCRIKAIALGAKEIPLREMAQNAGYMRRHGTWPTSEQLEAYIAERVARVNAVLHGIQLQQIDGVSKQ